MWNMWVGRERRNGFPNIATVLGTSTPHPAVFFLLVCWSYKTFDTIKKDKKVYLYILYIRNNKHFIVVQIYKLLAESPGFICVHYVFVENHNII